MGLAHCLLSNLCVTVLSEIRLANGPSRCQGRVEILYNGSWGTVCDDDWDIVDANVVCRQLGCGHAIALPAAMTFGQGSGPIFLDNVDCKGREAALSECWSHGWGIHNCYHYEDVAVMCNELSPTQASEGPTSRTATASVQHGESDGSIRLVSGTDSCQGRVEIFYRGNWGTVCDDDWGLSDASVVCKQVGCGQALDYKSNAYFGYGTGHILLDNVNCDGSEPFLSACYSLGWGIHNCGHHEDAGVICTGLDMSTVTSFTTSVALEYEETLTATATAATDGRDQPSQATEVITTALPTVEQDSKCAAAAGPARDPARTPSQAVPAQPRTSRVVCSVLSVPQHEGSCKGCSGNVPHAPRAPPTPPGGYPPAPGGSPMLSGVTHNHEISRGHPRAPGDSGVDPGGSLRVAVAVAVRGVAVPCRDPPAGGGVRLANGNGSCRGRVEVRHRGAWGTVCDDDWDFPDAQVVCRQLGCGAALSATGLGYFGYGSGPVLLDNVGCAGTEARLGDCFHLGWGQHNCGHHEDAGVVCRGADDSGDDFQEAAFTTTTLAPTHPEDGFLRLVNGSHRCEGRVEIFYLSQWGTVCDDAWDLRDAKVVCRQLGCGHAVAAWGEARYGRGVGYIFLDNLKCKGNEASLLRCSHIRWDVHNCDHSEDAGALCSLL
ncbi:scavenger receptor cysteine-rich domain-containing group B protein [Apteryx rowi]|uniref:scavenger receptor cysteine-rich domain-containing group B protein n=1 Tax=Apteryx rowi TaxID=308060 RepID=UPI000E1DDE6B|nr:scavenger receptor cysteine-rich domain-containing group B protein [Apteryx rowi]